MNIILLDVDNTIVPFQPTAELYKKTLFKSNLIKYFFIGYFMIIILKLFWFIPGVVTYQRRLMMSLLSRVDKNSLDAVNDEVVKRIKEHYNDKFHKFLGRFKKGDDKVFLLTHAPDIIAGKIIRELGFDGEFSIKLYDYLKTGTSPENINKLDIIRDLRKKFVNSKFTFIADDLIDLDCLLNADTGVLINASLFSRLFCSLFFKRILIFKHV